MTIELFQQHIKISYNNNVTNTRHPLYSEDDEDEVTYHFSSGDTAVKMSSSVVTGDGNQLGLFVVRSAPIFCTR